MSLPGFVVSIAAGGSEIRRLMDGASVDLTLLDLGLLDEHSIMLVRQLQEAGDLPGIVG
jgi:DNA-binding response OmpR family regulator